jgi:phytoene dehydrogenase-like protein
MADHHVIIIGGGLAGLSCGCYLQRNGFRTTVLEHNLALGGVCTSWTRPPYTVDGCIHWLTGGPFAQLYRELEILPAIELRTLDTWLVYRNRKTKLEIAIERNLDRLAESLRAISPVDADEIQHVRDAARRMVELHPPLRPQELMGPRDALRALWDSRGLVGTLAHFRKPLGVWARDRLHSPELQRIFTGVMSPEVPTLFLLMVLGYLEQGYLSRPVGGTEAFRAALEHTYRKLGGDVELHATVDEILVEADRAYGVRLADGTLRRGDFVVSTSSTPETVLRLLGGRYEADSLRDRLRDWKLFDPIVLCSFGVARPYANAPGLLQIDGLEPRPIVGRSEERLYVRVCNDDPCFAPAGHCVVQVMAPTQYEHWASCGSRYGAEKDAVAQALLEQLEPDFPDLKRSLRMTDVATPLTYWNTARSWRGAYEGWLPTTQSMFSHINKELRGLQGVYLCGQWVEPGGGVPTAVLSGRQAAQLLCERNGRPFVPTGSRPVQPRNG